MEDVPTMTPSSRRRARLRFVASWVLAGVLVAIGLPQVVSVSWHGVLPVLAGLHLSELLGLVGLWALGLYVHSFVLTAAAPSLNHRRALTLNVTGSAVANVVPLGGAAGVELNRRMMRAWGIDTRGFAGYTFVTNLWDVGIKLILPIVAVGALARAGEHVSTPFKIAALAAAVGFVAMVAVVTALLLSSRGPLEEIRRQSRQLVANGWLRMSVGMVGYVALQALLLGWCLHLTGAGNSGTEILAGFALERLITILPITPGGVGVADLGLVSVLLALGGDPVGVTAGAVLYRVFVFLVEIPVGGGALGLWLVGHRRTRPVVVAPRSGEIRRIAHVTDVFLPRLGGIETHVDDLVRHQRARGLEADVLSPTPGGPDPAWVRRIPAARARAEIGGYDVVHVHLSVLSPYSISVARAAMAAGVPTLITVHSMWAGASAIVRLAALASLRRWPVAWSAVSAAAAEAFRRSLGGAPVDVLPNAIDVASWRRPGAAARSAADPLTVVSVMRLMPRKRPLPLLRMFTDVRRLVPDRDVRLLIVGDGPLRGRVERYVRRHGLADVVTITGRVERDEVRPLLRSGAVYLAPAPKESFGLAALEARCAGLPIVASRRSGIREFVRDRRDGLLVDGDREMTVAVATLLTDDLLRERIRSHNDRVAPAYDWSDVLDTTMELYRTAGERVAVPLEQPEAVPL
ncbi:MAG TPA: glycosyltransferase [Nocardioides sp.]|nr:glycosyltransferase [Nocardioides sp.]